MQITATVADAGASLLVDAEDAGRLLKKHAPGVLLTVTVRERRSHARQGFYWALLTWAADNVPEDLQAWRFGPEVWHAHFKAQYGVSSTSFENMGEDDFGRYLDWVLDEIARIWQVEPFEISAQAGAAGWIPEGASWSKSCA